jgi:hypothetical protein
MGGRAMRDDNEIWVIVLAFVAILAFGFVAAVLLGIIG